MREAFSFDLCDAGTRPLAPHPSPLAALKRRAARLELMFPCFPPESAFYHFFRAPSFPSLTLINPDGEKVKSSSSAKLNNPKQ